RIDYRLDLGLALIKAGRFGEATIYLDEVLRQQPNSGPANVGVATIDAQEGRIDSAVTHYRRAIYGSWPNEPAQNRIRARIGLFEILRKSGRETQARAELLALAADVPDDSSLRKEVGRLLIDFGLVSEAAGLFRGLLKHGPPDPAEYDGLGEAELGMNNYTA